MSWWPNLLVAQNLPGALRRAFRSIAPEVEGVLVDWGRGFKSGQGLSGSFISHGMLWL